MRKVLLLLIMVMVTLGASYAQQRNVTGTVKSADDGLGIPGVNVVLKGTSTGDITDIDGKFNISIPSNNAVLVFSFVGLKTQEVTVGSRSVIDVVLESDVSQLEEVVVTAFGVKREKKALGYSVQEVGSKALDDSGADNALAALNGKAAGVNITSSSGSPGSAQRVVVRGNRSLIGNNQALIVVDGVRINNDANYTEGNTAGTSQASGLNAVNPADIESISVLKGAAASALYGTSGANGVLLITTKKGSKGSGLKVNYSMQVGFDIVSTLPELQTEFAQGSGGRPWDPASGQSGSWGGRITDYEYSTDRNVYETYYNDFYASINRSRRNPFDLDGNYIYDNNGFLVPRGQGNGQAPNVYDNLDDFYQTGHMVNNAVSISGGNDVATFRASISHLTQEGIIPNNTQDRTTFNVGTTLKATEKLSFSANVNYSRMLFRRIQQGSNTSGIGLGLFRTPPTFDNSNGFGPDAVDEPSSYFFASSGNQRNYRGGGGYDNPFWIVNLAPRDETNDKVFGNFLVNYKFSDWAQLSLNIGSDHTADNRIQLFERGSRTAPNGQVIWDNYKINQTDAYLQLSGGGNLSSKVGFNYFVGANAFSYRTERTYLQGDNIAFQGFVHPTTAALLTNVDPNNTTPLQRYRTLGIFGSAEFSYNNTLFMTVTARQDYDTRLADPEKSFKASDIAFFYPSVSMSYIFTENLDIKGLSFGKIRASIAQVGAGPPNAYSTSTVFTPQSPGDGWGTPINFPIAGTPGFETFGTLGNAELKPETTTSIEIGTDLRFLDGRIGLDFAYYVAKGKDQILNASLARSTGYSNYWLNAGEMTTRGTEAVITAVPIKKSDFTWETTINFTRAISTVDKLAPGLERLQIGGFTGTGIFLVAGNTYGSIFGGAYRRQGAGGEGDDGLNIPGGPIVIQDDPGTAENPNLEFGYQAVDNTLRAIGDTNPDFTIGFRNSFTYKRVNLSFLIDWKQGGDMWNGTNWALSFFGASQLTAETREEAATPIAGVKSDGTPNDIAIVRDQSYWQSSVGGFGSVDEQFVQDAGWVRLRELSINYQLNPSIFGGKFIKGLSVGFIGRNLWYTTKYDGVDPETSLTGNNNSQGLDYFNQAGSRSFIFRLNANF